jgi:dipeptidyl aminopeptidase/acylaminoacyl peptidase
MAQPEVLEGTGMIRHVLLWMLVWMLLVGAGCQSRPLAAQPIIGKLSLAQARKQHPTRLIRQGPAPQPYDDSTPPDVQRIRYSSAGRQLMAWLASPATAGLHPAVLFAHGGFALGEGDWEDVRPFVQAGFVVLLPTYRGENGNPGSFERYFGEVDDALAALDHLAKMPGVDSHRLFVAGHSVGGTTAMLLAEMSPRIRGAAACGAFPDLTAALEKRLRRPNSADFPFDYTDSYETDLRSPARFVKDLKCPLAIFNSAADRLYVKQAAAMQAQAHHLGKSVTNETFPNTDHNSALAPAVHKMIALFKRE